MHVLHAPATIYKQYSSRKANRYIQAVGIYQGTWEVCSIHTTLYSFRVARGSQEMLVRRGAGVFLASLEIVAVLDHLVLLVVLDHQDLKDSVGHL